MQSRSRQLPPSLCWGSELSLQVIVVVFGVAHHDTADDPDDDARHKKRTTDIPSPIRDHIDQVPGYPKRKDNET